jgi:hypothetical protein
MFVLRADICIGRAMMKENIFYSNATREMYITKAGL